MRIRTRLTIVTALDMKTPQAPVVRIRSISRALNQTGLVDCSVLSLGPQGSMSSRRLSRAIPYSMRWRADAVKKLWRRLGAEQVDVVMLVDRDAILSCIYSIACKLRHVRIVSEVTEFPDAMDGRTVKIRVKAMAYWRALRMSHGVIAISDPIAAEIRSRLRVEPLILPAFVDCEQFRPRVDRPDGAVEIGYAGSLVETKDGPRALIRAFVRAKSSARVPLRLTLVVGGHSVDDRAEVMELVAALGVADSVSVAGPYPVESMPEVLRKFDILVLPRPESRQAHGGFPTKLGEYLATGVPVVATRVGPVELFLKDRVSAFLVAPSQEDELVSALDELAHAPVVRHEVGAAGRDAAKQALDVRVHAKRLAEFLGGIR